MKTFFPFDDINIIPVNYCIELKTMQSIYYANGFVYQEGTNLTLSQIINFNMRPVYKVWFLIKMCELTDSQLAILKNDLASIVLPIFTNIYPSSSLNQESADVAISDGNFDAEKSCKANCDIEDTGDFSNDTLNTCFNCVAAAFYHCDTSYMTSILNYLITFVNDN